MLLALAYMALLLGVPRAALSARVAFPASVLLACYCVTVFARRVERSRERALTLLLVGLVALSAAIVAPGLTRLASISRAWGADVAGRAGTDAVVPAARVGGKNVYAHKHLFFEGITADPASFIDVCYARVMHLQSVRTE